MKNIISMICLLLSMCFVACHDDDNEEKGPQLAFSELIYTLDAEEPLKVEIRVSEPVSANTSVKFNIRGPLYRGRNMSFLPMNLLFPRERPLPVLP